MAEPIYVPCEGTGNPPAFPTYPICPMCGQWINRAVTGSFEPHQRRDILAEIDRGEVAQIDGNACAP